MPAERDGVLLLEAVRATAARRDANAHRVHDRLGKQYIMKAVKRA
jgi:hypothetical protein